MVVFAFFCFFLLINSRDLGAAQEQDECQVSRCNHGGPPVRFPFRLEGQQLEHCGYAGFELSCKENKQMVMELPSGVQFLVKHINYTGQWIYMDDPDSCLLSQLPSLDLSTSPFYFSYEIYTYARVNYTLFNCSGEAMSYPGETDYYKLPCLSSSGNRVQAVTDGRYLDGDKMLNCRRISNMFEIPAEIIIEKRQGIYLSWSKPVCRHCEAQQQACRLKRQNSSQIETECYGFIRKSKGSNTRLKVTVISLGSLALALVVVALLYFYHSYRKEKKSQLKIESFLEDYRALKPSRYSYADIKRITDEFKEKLGQGAYGTVYKGRLSKDVLVAVKVLDNFIGNGEDFINEVGSMCRIYHINITRLAGFCADGYHRALIYEYLPNESLEKFIFTSNDESNRLLSWEKLQDIALGIAKGIEYLHQGCEQRILHFDIKPQNILLDQNFIPKISDFGLAKLCSKDQSAVSMTAGRGTVGYIAPEVLSRNFGNVSYKADVYSYGMLLLEMVGGRKNIDLTVERTSQAYFPQWVYSRINKGEDLGIIIEDEEHAKIAKKLTTVGLWCIQWYPADRPPMKAVVQMLEGETSSLTIPPNPFPSTDAIRAVAAIGKKAFDREQLPAIPE